MLTDLDAANLCAACYSAPTSFDDVIDVDGVWVGVKRTGGDTAVAFRGSITAQDWFRDFQGLMVQDPELGGVEAGFSAGLRELLPRLLPLLAGDVLVTGHSLGAARALIFAGLLPPGYHSRVVTFGSPRPGGFKLKNVLADVPIRSYRNGQDPVCTVPFPLAWLFCYTHPRALISVSSPPADGDASPLRLHHIQLYQQAMEKLHAS